MAAIIAASFERRLKGCDESMVNAGSLATGAYVSLNTKRLKRPRFLQKSQGLGNRGGWQSDNQSRSGAKINQRAR